MIRHYLAFAEDGIIGDIEGPFPDDIDRDIRAREIYNADDSNSVCMFDIDDGGVVLQRVVSNAWFENANCRDCVDRDIPMIMHPCCDCKSYSQFRRRTSCC